MLSLERFIAAHNRIKNNIYKTPLEESLFFRTPKRRVYLKLENQQKTKSFKIRGALNKISLLTEEEKKRGILAVSSGNHGIAVSYAAKLMGLEKTIVFLPKGTPKVKIDKIRGYGAEVIIAGEHYDEMQAIGMAYLKEHNMTFIDPYNKDYDVYAGQGTVGLEIMLERPEIDTLLVPVSGGGLVTGVGIAAKLIKPSLKVIGVQTSACPAFVRSLEEKVLYEEYPVKPSICEALMGGAGVEPYKLASQSMDTCIEVSEEAIKKATELMIKKEKIILEPSSAVGIAALMEKPECITGKSIGVVISGGNIEDEFIKFVAD